ncbi:MAG TPA: hypothetical protein VG871_06160 [Vicinamibacterales bacterium]|nr:hypothetical protein [Vicinamibacterales bacterium]
MATVSAGALLSGPQDTSADPALDVQQSSTASLAVGKYTVTVTVTDDLGMKSQSAPFTFEVRAAPVVNVTGPTVVGYAQNFGLKAAVQTTGKITDYTWSVKGA